MSVTTSDPSLSQRLRESLGEAVPAAAGDLRDCTRAASEAGVGERDLLAAMARSLRIEYIEDLSSMTVADDFVTAIPIGFARQHRVLGFAGENGTMRVALADPAHWEQLQVVSRFVRRTVEPFFAPVAAVSAAINQAYEKRSGQARAFIETLDRADVLAEVRRLSGRADLLDGTGRAPVVRLVDLVLLEAVKSEASDVHIQPYEENLVIRTRIDGMLYDSYTLPKNIQDEIVSRVKVMGRMNIAEKRVAQDGRATVQMGDRIIDLRIASLPTSYGERIVIRLLDKSARLYELTELGMDARTLRLFKQLITVEHGLILVTGPTGSGKSTTLYSALKQINSKEKNVLTLEDPIEYQLEGISQTQVSDKKGMTFASGLRSVLRQDPDVIMVGEIRDRETATMAIQSSLTGHVVFSTLHTNDAASAVTRLLDLNIEPYLVASSVVGVLAQRLVRLVCPACARPYAPHRAELEWLDVAADDAAKMRQGAGCDACRGTGYRGRQGTFELLVVDDEIRRLISARVTAVEIKAAAVAAGTRTLRDDGIRKILAGATTISEVERVTLEPEVEANGD
jgi:general secretion pathway protein E